jgi:CIC family chloride channel protein
MVAWGGVGDLAAYNAPIAGALFVAECMVHRHGSFGPCDLVQDGERRDSPDLGYGSVFAVPHVQFGANWELFFYGVLGVVIGHLAPAFLALLRDEETLRDPGSTGACDASAGHRQADFAGVSE